MGKCQPLKKIETALKLQGGSKSAIEIATQAVRKGGTVSMVGVYGAKYNLFPLGDFFSRNVTLKMGQCPAQAYLKPILELSLSIYKFPILLLLSYIFQFYLCLFL